MTSGIISGILFYLQPYACNVGQNYIPMNIVVFYIFVTTAIFFVIGISRLMNTNRIATKMFSFFGKNSLIIFSTMQVYIDILGPLGRIISTNPNTQCVFLFVFLAVIEILTCLFINNKLYFILGK